MRREDCHEQMAVLRADGMLLKDIGKALGLKDATVIHHLRGRCACYAERAWRSPERVRERQAYTVEVAEENPEMTLMEISLKVFERFGNPETGKPVHFSTVIYHLRTAGMSTKRRTAATTIPNA